MWNLSGFLWPVSRRVASLYRSAFLRKTRIVVVVGSFGKTTTARATACAMGLKDRQRIRGNALSAVAMAVLRTRPKDSHAVIEAGISKEGMMENYAAMIRPDVAVVTSIGSEHMTSLKSLDVTRREKFRMVEILPSSGIAVLNGDDPNVRWMKERSPARTVLYGLDKENDVYASDIRLDWPHGSRFKLHLEGKVHDVRVRLFGKYMVYPILAAVTTAYVEGRSVERAISVLGELEPTQNRMELFRLSNGAFVLLDAFKSQLETVEAALEVFAEVPAERRTVVIGQITEPPGSLGQIWRDLGRRIAEIASRAVYLGPKKEFARLRVGATSEGMPSESLSHVGRSVSRAIELVKGDLHPGEVILLKGRYEQRLERVALALSGRRVECDQVLCFVKGLRCRSCERLSGKGK